MPSYDPQVNGQTYTVEAEAQMPLLWVLRDLLGLTGSASAISQSDRKI